MQSPIKPISAYTYVGGANTGAQDFPVFCSDNYPVDPRYWFNVWGLYKDSVMSLYVSPTNPFYYQAVAYTHNGYHVLCEDL